MVKLSEVLSKQQLNEQRDISERIRLNVYTNHLNLNYSLDHEQKISNMRHKILDISSEFNDKIKEKYGNDFEKLKYLTEYLNDLYYKHDDENSESMKTLKQEIIKICEIFETLIKSKMMVYAAERDKEIELLRNQISVYLNKKLDV